MVFIIIVLSILVGALFGTWATLGYFIDGAERQLTMKLKGTLYHFKKGKPREYEPGQFN